MAAATEVRWQTHIKSVSEGACHIYETKEFSNVKIRVQGKVFDAHSLILAARSSEFARLLMNPTATDEIIVDRSSPVTANGFGVLLHYIYKNELNTTNKKSIIEGYLAAKYYKQKAMLNACSEEIESWEITHDEVCDLLDIDCGIEALDERCLSYVRINGLAVITSDSFPKASFKSLSVILKSGALKDIPALEKIRCVMKWGKHQYPSASDYSPVRKLLLNCQPPLLGMLEFEKLTVEELDDVFEEYKGLLLDSEFPKFVSYITKKKQVLPCWCSAAV